MPTSAGKASAFQPAAYASSPMQPVVRCVMRRGHASSYASRRGAPKCDCVRIDKGEGGESQPTCGSVVVATRVSACSRACTSPWPSWTTAVCGWRNEPGFDGELPQEKRVPPVESVRSGCSDVGQKRVPPVEWVRSGCSEVGQFWARIDRPGPRAPQARRARPGVGPMNLCQGGARIGADREPSTQNSVARSQRSDGGSPFRRTSSWGLNPRTRV